MGFSCIFAAMQTNEYYMQECLRLAELGRGHVAPNPMVGCVIVCRGEIIGSGYHEYYGGPHAEVNAIRSVKDPELLKESTLFVNLEPCAHFGKTPPCSNLIIEVKIPEVVVGCVDSNSLVGGKGIERMREAGIKVTTACLENKCRALNKRFYTFHEKKRPYIILKWAQTADHFIDKLRSWPTKEQTLKISGEEAKRLLHQWRSEEQAILVGTRTALLDNPSLTVREISGNNPVRCVIDRKLELPNSLQLFNGEAKTLIFTEKTRDNNEHSEYIQLNFDEVILPQMMAALFARNIQSILVEGGTYTLEQFLAANLWDEIRVVESKNKIGAGVAAPAVDLSRVVSKKVGEDNYYLIEKESVPV